MTALSEFEAGARHAIRHFQERCGIELPRDEYEKMNEAIRSQRVPHVARTDNRVRVFKVRFGGITAFAAWNSRTQQIGTFYPDLSWVTTKGGEVEVSWARSLPSTILASG